jgi:hypothetical protein
MTLHTMLMTADGDGCPDGFVWASDRKVSFEHEQSADTEKIVYLEECKIACSAWGNGAIAVRDEFVKRVRDGSLRFSTSQSDSNTECLRGLAEEIAKDGNNNRGLVAVVFGDSLPSAYRVDIKQPAFPVPLEYYNLFAGDQQNPARIFASYYHAMLSGKSLPETLLLAVHTMRLAQLMKLDYLSDPNVWFYAAGKFQRLSPKELAGYVRLSKALDEAFMEKVRSLAPKREPSPLAKLLREES